MRPSDFQSDTLPTELLLHFNTRYASQRCLWFTSLGKFGDRTNAEFIDTNVSSSYELFETPIVSIDKTSTSDVQIMSENNYYTT